MIPEMMQMKDRFSDTVSQNVNPHGFTEAATYLSPLLLNMARGLREGRGASAYAGRGRVASGR